MRGLIFILCFRGFVSLGQQNLIPIHSFYKDQIFANKLAKPYNDGSFFPVRESQYDILPAINDSSKQYYDFTYALFQKNLIEISGKDFRLSINPVLDFSIGKNLSDTIARRLFQNTRGFHVEGDLFTNFSFSTTLFENQARFNLYESVYYSSIGELYPRPDSSYQTQNAVVPGGGRTKPFKGDAFDYSSAVGYFVYAPIKRIAVTVGNNMQFVGDGYRSLLLSDNSFNAPYFRVDWSIHPKFNFTYLRSRYINLLRKPISSSAESYYEAKGYSVNYFTYKPSEKGSISLFESGNWNRGDSIVSKSSNPMFYNPVPFLSGLVLKDKNEVVSLLGLNVSYQLAKDHRVYGQFAVNDYDAKKTALQLGYRGYDYFGVGDFMLQLEYNYVANATYETQNRRLNNIQYNLPVAHVKGNGFQEFLLRTNYEIKRFYVDLTLVYYLTDNYSATALLPIYDAMPRSSNSIFYENVELGYRFNRKMNLMLFSGWTYRIESNSTQIGTNSFTFGLKTGLRNNYKDF
tara:strand:+ start:7681 stop:9228 length:1548 start_codon:yes stop_codon:yes gene_type:complete